ncbi:MAG TPA: MFS transporter [Rhizomicrobium sp.]|nr:MFS transporter [Rhizomicrobium sp.]
MNAATKSLTSLRTKLFYGLGSIAFGVKDNGFSTLVLLFYNQVVGLPSQLVGSAILIALVFDAFLDPIVGTISDNLRSRWGRRHPFMYFSALPVALSYLLLFNPPHWSQGALFVYLIVVSIVVRTFITLYEIPSSALVAELSDDYDQRTVFFAYRYFFGWFGGLGMSILAFAVLLTPDKTHPVGQLNPAGYVTYGIVAAIIMFFAILISAAGTHRHIPQFHVPKPRRIGVGQMMSEMFATLANRSFLILTISGVFFYVATGLVFALNVYFQTYLWQLSAAQISIFTVMGFVAAALAFVFALPLSRRFGKKISAIVLFVLALAVGCVPLTLRLLNLFPPNGAPSLMPLLLIFATLSLTLSIASSILMASMLTDIVEENALKTGRRSEGLFFAANSFLQKVVSGAGVFASGLLLWLVGFPANAQPGHIDMEIVRNLALVYLPVLVLLYGIAMVFLGFYRITRENHEENLKRLAEEMALAKPLLD